MDARRFSAAEGGRFGPQYWGIHPKGGRVWIRPATMDEVPWLHHLTVSEIGSGVGPERAMRDVHAKNGDALWVVEHAPYRGALPEIAGYYSFLPLTDDGLAGLKAGTLHRPDPPLDQIVEAGKRPAALYLWAVVARGLTRAVNPLIKEALVDSYFDVPVYCVSVTPKGLTAARRRGFVPINGDNGFGTLALLPLVDPNDPSRTTGEGRAPRDEHKLEMVVAANAEHLNMVAFIRGATFGAEQSCPYREEYDDNDYCATHILGFVDGEPAAVIRMRYFGTFAKLERLAVLPRFRRTKIKYEVVEAALEIARRKGFTKFYGQSQQRLVEFYAKFGFRPMHKNSELIFSDHSYVEIEVELAPHPEPIVTASDPYLIIRPEGRWHLPGILEASAHRPATNPH